MQPRIKTVNPLYVPYDGSDPTEPETDPQKKPMTKEQWIKWAQGK